MKAALLVALREYRQVIATRGFRVMLFGLPLLLAIAVFASRSLTPTPISAFVMADASGRFAPAIRHRMELDYQRRVMIAVFAYAGRASPETAAWYSDAEVEAFMASGGAQAALRKLEPKLPPGTAPFKPLPRTYLLVAPPPGVPVDR